MRQVHRSPCDPVQFERIEARKNVAGYPADRHGFPWTHDEVGQHHHPASGEADRLRKNFGGVGDFAGGVRHGHDQPAIDIPDRQQQSAAQRESQDAAQGTAAQQPVVHYYQPADSHHGSPSQGEVVDDAEFAGESGLEGGSQFSVLSSHFRTLRSLCLSAGRRRDYKAWLLRERRTLVSRGACDRYAMVYIS